MYAKNAMLLSLLVNPLECVTITWWCTHFLQGLRRREPEWSGKQEYPFTSASLQYSFSQIHRAFYDSENVLKWQRSGPYVSVDKSTDTFADTHWYEKEEWNEQRLNADGQND